ncbi:hypothetical protein Q5M60_04810 [Acinetobacter baumannii]|nr:hypothetical protein [Acinetobacter baumannii]
MNKYDWSNVDSRLSFLATDCDGLVYGFTHEPKLTDWGFAPTNGFSKQVYGACCGFGFGSEWRESLEERPKDPAMSEFEGKSGKWAWEIQKEQQANLDGLKKSLSELAQKYKHDAHASSLFGDQDKARVYNRFANELEHLLKGGA